MSPNPINIGIIEYLPIDCINNIETFLDVHGYIQWSKSSNTIKKNMIKIECIGEYNDEWIGKDHYFGSIIIINDRQMRHGFGIYTLYKNKTIIKTICYWNKNIPGVNKKVITIDAKKNEKWIVKHSYDIKIHYTIPQKKSYYGGWKNNMRNGIGQLTMSAIKNGNISNGYWLKNTKHGCHNEIFYNYERDDGLWNRHLENIYINYYDYDHQLPFSLRINEKKVFIIDRKKGRTTAFGVGSFIAPITICNNILRILSIYTDTSSFKYKTIYPFSIIDMACNKNKYCNCELCNHIIKNEKYYKSLITPNICIY